MNKLSKNLIFTLGLLSGITLIFVLSSMRAENKKQSGIDSDLTLKKSLRKTNRVKKSAKAVKSGDKGSRITALLSKMKPNRKYSQKELGRLLETVSYRTVRRYVKELAKQGKVKVTGYGKGQKTEILPRSNKLFNLNKSESHAESNY